MADRTDFLVTIENDLDKLFALQDRPLSAVRRTLMANELLATPIPIPALLAGIKSLMNEEVTHIKFATICAAARRHVIADTEIDTKCGDCHDGLVVMRDDAGRSFALACMCPMGAQKAMANRLVRWDGKAGQYSNKRLLSQCG